MSGAQGKRALVLLASLAGTDCQASGRFSIIWRPRYSLEPYTAPGIRNQGQVTMNDTLQNGSRQRVEELLERYRRSSRRATLIAVAALVLALSAVIGVWLSRSPSPAKAGDGDVNSQLSSAFIEIARAVEPSVVNV